MQEIDVTPRLLVEFSTEYGRVPLVDLGETPKCIPFTHHVLAAWVSAFQHGDNNLYHVFTGWLCGRGQFVHPDVKGELILCALADALREVVDVPSK